MSTNKKTLNEIVHEILRMQAPWANEEPQRRVANKVAEAIKAAYAPPVPKCAPPELVEAAWNAVSGGNPASATVYLHRDDMRHAINTVLAILHDRTMSQPPPTPEMPGVVSSYCGIWDSTTLVKLIESAIYRAPAGAETEWLASCVASAIIERMQHPLLDKSQPVDALMLMCLNLVRVGREGQAMPRGSVPSHVDFPAQMRAPTGDIYKDTADSIYGKAQQFNANPADTLNAPYGNTFRAIDENDARLRDASIAFKALDNEAALGTLNDNLVELQRALHALAADISGSIAGLSNELRSSLDNVAGSIRRAPLPPAPMLYDPTCPPATEDEPPRVTATSPFQLYATGVDRCDWCKRGGYNRCNHRLVGVRRG